MGFFSRNKEAAGTGAVPDLPFETRRRPSRDAPRPRDSRFDAPSPLDPAETAKTRARRRLIGAVVLALAAIVFVPMLFDRAPVAVTGDIALQIPDRDTPFEGRRGVPDSAHGLLKGASEPVVAPPVVASPPTQASPEAADKLAEKTADKPAEKPVDKPAEKAAQAVVDKPAAIDVPPKPAEPVVARPAAAKPAVASAAVPPAAVVDKPKPATPTDDPKALAALEGRPDAALAAGVGASGKGYAVQVAAFSAAEKARGLRDQLVANGMRSYTESVSTSQGLRVRVRLGPFPSREAADHAKEKLKTMKLDGSVVPL